MRVVPLLLISLSLLAGDDLTITATEEVSQSVKPDVMRGVLNYREDAVSAEAIKKDLNAIVAEVKRRDPKAEQCRGGGYRLTPRYSYKDQKQAFEGYSGTLSFDCAFGSIGQYDALTAAINKVSAPGVKKTQGALRWVVGDATRQAVEAQLRGSLIAKTYAEAKRFAKATDSACRVSAVTFGGASMPAPVMLRSVAVAAEASAPTESPLLSDEEVTLSATVVYVCEPR